jgi:uncharacterized MAPEG superfamily protein
MTSDLYFLAYAAVLTWIMLLSASLMRARAWTPLGLILAFGNRDNIPEPFAAAARADRAARNMLENLVLLAALLFAAHAGNVHDPRVAQGAQIFFWARLVYFPVYVAGIIYLRTAIWAVGVWGLLQILLAVLHG